MISLVIYNSTVVSCLAGSDGYSLVFVANSSISLLFAGMVLSSVYRCFRLPKHCVELVERLNVDNGLATEHTYRCASLRWSAIIVASHELRAFASR